MEVVKKVGNLLFGGSSLKAGPDWLAPVEEPRLKFPLGERPTWKDLEERSPEELVKLMKKFFPLQPQPLDSYLLLDILRGKASAMRVKRVGNLILGGTVFDAVKSRYHRWRWIAPTENPELKAWVVMYLPLKVVRWEDLKKRQIDLLSREACEIIAQALEREGMKVEPDLLMKTLEGKASMLEVFMLHFLSLI